jgi:hypothetical protein
MPDRGSGVAVSRQLDRYDFRLRNHDLDFAQAHWTLGATSEPEPEPLRRFRSVIADKTWLNYEAVGNEEPKSMTFSRRPERVRSNLLFSTLGPVIGRWDAFGDETFADLLRAGAFTLQETSEDLGGVACRVLVANTRYGKVACWIAPDRGFVAMKVTIDAGPDDVYNGKPLSAQSLKEMHYVYEVRALKEFGRHVVPVNARLTKRVELEPTGVDNSETVFKLSKVVVDPDFKSMKDAFLMSAPDGVRVFDIDSSKPGNRFEWRGGKVVPIAGK